MEARTVRRAASCREAFQPRVRSPRAKAKRLAPRCLPRASAEAAAAAAAASEAASANVVAASAATAACVAAVGDSTEPDEVILRIREKLVSGED
jgi:hypothetical protein